jgi:hypothetical protein
MNSSEAHQVNEAGEESDTRFRLKKVITLGDMLTPLSVLASLVALWITWSHDADLKRKQYADQIRHSASVVTAKIERWSPLADRYFEDIQPTIVDVAEKVEETTRDSRQTECSSRA